MRRTSTIVINGPYRTATKSLRRALAALPRQQRAVLMLRYHAGLTEAATARTLGIGVGHGQVLHGPGTATLRADPALRELIGVGDVPGEGLR